MREKKARFLVFKEIEHNPEGEEEHMNLEKPIAQQSFKAMTRRERIREASRPLYLKRYE